MPPSSLSFGLQVVALLLLVWLLARPQPAAPRRHTAAAATSAAAAVAVAAEPEDELTRAVRLSNVFSVDTAGLDHAPVSPHEQYPGRVAGHQAGPCRSARAMAIVQLAVAEAYALATRARTFYLPASAPPRPSHTSHAPSAVYEATRVSLNALFPSHAARVDAYFASVGGRSSRAGRDAALAVLANRSADGSQHAEPHYGVDYLPRTNPPAAGEWTPDPTTNNTVALGARWSGVRPFLLRSAAQFRAPPPPALASSEYAMAYDEVLSLGGDNVTTPTVRDVERERIGILFAYDGTPSLCAPPRLYNQMAQRLALDTWNIRGAAYLRLLAVLHTTMADAAIAAWETKYFYRVWRPVTGIRRADEDGNDNTVADPTYTPLGAPLSNVRGPANGPLGFTPPFPAYPSGHAVFGAAALAVLRHAHGGKDELEGGFVFVSQEYDGVTRDSRGVVRPLLPRYFATLRQIEEENAQSRMYLGIHWCSDKTAGVLMGRKVADYVLSNFGWDFAPGYQ